MGGGIHMSRVLIRMETEYGSVTHYRCPMCGHYRQKDQMVWERSPAVGDPGKVCICRFCAWPEVLVAGNAPIGWLAIQSQPRCF